MTWKNPLSGCFVVCIAACVMISAQSEDRKAHYMGYRNPRKPGLAVLPVQSRKLERPVRDMLSQALLKEAVKLDSCRLVPFPEEVRLDSMGQVPPQALTLLHDRYGIEMILQSKLDHAPDKNDFYAEIIATQSGDISASFHQDCQCPVGELVMWMVPETIRKLNMTMKLRAPRCPPGTVLITASVIPGSNEPDSTGKAWGSGNFCIDAYEYPNAIGGTPLIGKTWKDASDLCAANGKRLCSEPEWELACGAAEGLDYPYGREYDKNKCNTQSQTIQLSGGNPECRSRSGAFDLSGNVYEWTSSEWSGKCGDKVVKGGNWNSGSENSQCRARFGQKAGEPSQAIGFRCCVEAKH